MVYGNKKILEKFKELKEEKKSVLCIGLDPALPKQRNKWVIPKKYIKEDENETRLLFCLDIIDKTSDFAIAFKINLNYVFGLTKKDHKVLVKEIHNSNCLAILDCKLNDIGDTIESGIFHIRECEYDAITFNPIFGNLKFLSEIKGDLGVFVITLPSNKESQKYFKECKINNEPLFKIIAREVREYAEGCVVGITEHVTVEDIKEIREIIGEKIMLIPGIGAQGGDINKLKFAGKEILVNVGRDIIYSEDPPKKAMEYKEKIWELIS